MNMNAKQGYLATLAAHGPARFAHPGADRPLCLAPGSTYPVGHTKTCVGHTKNVLDTLKHVLDTLKHVLGRHPPAGAAERPLGRHAHRARLGSHKGLQRPPRLLGILFTLNVDQLL